jgi:colanic acid/amylovoran biosynthesis glycosyltransferase
VETVVTKAEERANLRIAYIVGSFPYVTETFVINQVVGMAARGYQVDIYTTVSGAVGDIPASVQRYRLMERTSYLFGSPNYVLRFLKALLWVLRDGLRLARVSLRSLNVFRYGRSAVSLGLLCAALTLQRRNGGCYDIVHCQFGTYGELALRLLEIGAMSGKLVVSFRGYDATKYLREHPHAYDELFLRAARILPVSEALTRRLVEAGCDRAKIVVHHSGIECAKFRYILRQRSQGEPTQLLSVARLTEKKGIEYAVRAVAHLVEAGRVVSYWIVGEGPLDTQLESLIEELGVGKQVRLLGWRNHNEVVNLLERSHILMVTRKGFPMP